MRPQLGAYRNPFMLTPNLDKLAAEGLVFDNADTQFAVSLAKPARAQAPQGGRIPAGLGLSF